MPVGTSVMAVDRATGASLALDVTPAVQGRIRKTWAARAVALERWCMGREIRYLRVDARETLWTALRDLLRPRGAGVLT